MTRQRGDLTGRILVFDEKHGRRFFLADTEEKLHAAALKIVKERKEEGWYYDPAEEERDKPESMTMTDEQVEALPVPSGVKRNIRVERENYRQAVKRWERDKANYALIVKAVNENDGKTAFEILKIRDDYEYEGWSFEYLE